MRQQELPNASNSDLRCESMLGIAAFFCDLRDPGWEDSGFPLCTLLLSLTCDGHLQFLFALLVRFV